MLPECYEGARGGDYRGHVNTTATGQPCQSWDAHRPHAHAYSAHERPTAGLGAHNYCRNPGEVEAAPWCFTTDPAQRWGLCDVGDAAAAPCAERVSVGGDAAIVDGVLRLTSRDPPHQFGHATIPAWALLPPSLAGSAPSMASS